MFVKRMTLKNFRCFSDLSIDFDEHCTVLTGRNSSGKSSVLDALSIALGSYLTGVTGGTFNSLSQDDVRLQSFKSADSSESKNTILNRKMFSAEIEAEVSAESRDFHWKRSLLKEGGRTKTTDSKPITEYSLELRNAVSKGKENLILPVIAYYGTERLYRQKKDSADEWIFGRFERTHGYDHCLDTASDEALFLRWFRRMLAIEYQNRKSVPELMVVKQAMGRCYACMEAGTDTGKERKEIPDFDFKTDSHEFEIEYINSECQKERLPFRMLSDSLRITLSMIGDLASRMAMLNPDFQDDITKKTPGIVMIDDIDMRLHPAWQKSIIGALRNIFPEVQFIITAHSPTVLANIDSPSHIRMPDHNAISVPDFKTSSPATDDLMECAMNRD